MNAQRIVSIWAICVVFSFSFAPGRVDALAPSSSLEQDALGGLTEEEWLRKVGERLRECLGPLGWSQRELVRQVKRMGESLEPYQISDYVFGKRAMRTAMLFRIVRALQLGARASGLSEEAQKKMTAHYLLTEETAPPPIPEGAPVAGSLRERLLYLRGEETREEVNQRAKISCATLQNLERPSYYNTSIVILVRLSRAHNVSCDYLLVEPEPLSPREVAKNILLATREAYLKQGLGNDESIQPEDLIAFLAERTGKSKDKIRSNLKSASLRVSTAVEFANALDTSLDRLLLREKGISTLPKEVKYYPDTFGGRIRYLRLFIKGGTNAKLAKRTGLSHTYLCHIQTKIRADITDETAIALATALGVPLDYLIPTNKTAELVSSLIPGYPPNEVMPFGRTWRERIINRIEQLNLTFELLAPKIGKENRQEVDYLLAGFDIQSATLAKFAKGLDVSAHWIATGKEPLVTDKVIRSYREAMRNGMTVGEWLRTRREDKQISELANGDRRLSRILHDFELGTYIGTSYTLAQLSKAYDGVPVDFLLSEEMAERLISQTREKAQVEEPRAAAALSTQI